MLAAATKTATTGQKTVLLAGPSSRRFSYRCLSTVQSPLMTCRSLPVPSNTSAIPVSSGGADSSVWTFRFCRSPRTCRTCVVTIVLGGSPGTAQLEISSGNSVKSTLGRKPIPSAFAWMNERTELRLHCCDSGSGSRSPVNSGPGALRDLVSKMGHRNPSSEKNGVPLGRIPLPRNACISASRTPSHPRDHIGGPP